MEVSFEGLQGADLVVDTVYKGGKISGKGSEVLSKLLPNCSNSGGFRKVMRKDGSGMPAYVVLYSSMQELAWPDYLDEETGIFRYYGDNRTPGRTILDTPRKGNQLLEFVFACLNSRDGSIKNIPPFLIFKKGGSGWDVQFLGLAAPGNPKISPDKDLVAFWRTMDDKRFQNYEAYFTVLETEKPIVAAVIKAVNKKGEPIIFATQRGYGSLKGGWEFPGGKIEPDETPQEALKREIMEELDTEIAVGEVIDTIEYDYPDFHLSMDCFWCEIVSGDIKLKEHEAARWLTKEKLKDVEWLPADVTLISKIEKDM